ncbi:MAG: hypothetical protein AAF389_18810 [Gemmatimonadota bacterium]
MPRQRLLTMAGAICTAVAASALSAQQSANRCVVEEPSRHPVHLGGDRYGFVEPHFFDHVGGVFTLLGHPTYVWEIEGGTSSLVEQRSFVGVRIFGDSVQAVPNPPVDGEIGWLRAARVGPTHVSAVFDVQTDGPDRPSRAFVADLRGAIWGEVEALPDVPGGGAASIARASEPILDDDVLRFAVPFGPANRTALFERGKRGWSVSTLEGAGVAAVSVGPAGRRVAEVGQTMSSGGARPFVRITELSTGEEALRLLDVDRVLDARGVVWSVDGGHLAVAVVTPSGGGALVLDSDLEGSGTLVETPGRLLSAVPIPSVAPSWLMDGVSGGPGGSLGILSAIPSGAVIARIDTPYRGPAAAIVEPSKDDGATAHHMVAVGPEARFPPAQPFVRSLLIRTSITCS